MNIDYYIKSISNSLISLEEEVQSQKLAHQNQIEKLQSALNIGKLNSNYEHVKFPEINSYIDETSYSREKNYKISISYFNLSSNKCEKNTYDLKNILVTPENIKTKISELIKLNSENHIKNKEIYKRNRDIISTVLNIIHSCGFKTEKNEWNSRKRKNEKTLIPWQTLLTESSCSYEYDSLNLELFENELYHKVDQIFEKQKILKEDDKARTKVKALENPLLQDAINWLSDNGKVLGKDFDIISAVAEANSLAYDKEVAKIKAVGGPFEFDGSDNCENCDGWDGEDHRCSCGNRRVSWAKGYGHSFKNPHVRAEAN